MNNTNKGDKHICSNCGTRFFDLNRTKIFCPKCNTEVSNKITIVNSITTKKENNTNTNSSINDDSIVEFENSDVEDNLESEDDNSTIVDLD